MQNAVIKYRLQRFQDLATVQQSPPFLEAIEEHGFNCCIGGARRDEEKARANERIMSFRDEFGQWDPKNQRPELWDIFNAKVHQLMNKDAGIDIQLVSLPDPNGLAGLSDQRNYWKFGYQALMINDTSFVRNPHYHQKSDTIDTLDFAKMTEVINSSFKAIINIMN